MGISLAGSNPARSAILEHVSILRATSSFEYEAYARARLAQSVEHQTFNLRVAGSSPSSGDENFREKKNFGNRPNATHFVWLSKFLPP